MPSAQATPPWWHGAVIYQLYVRSWRDSNDDGYGDLRGIIEQLDHLTWLGVDAIWLSPTMPSPDEDWGYDRDGRIQTGPLISLIDPVEAETGYIGPGRAAELRSGGQVQHVAAPRGCVDALLQVPALAIEVGGGTVSLKLIVCTQPLLFPQASCAIQVRRIMPLPVQFVVEIVSE